MRSNGIKVTDGDCILPLRYRRCSGDPAATSLTGCVAVAFKFILWEGAVNVLVTSLGHLLFRLTFGLIVCSNENIDPLQK